MSGMLTRFRVEALHNFYTIDIPIIDNTLILVGENGTGKSTVVNLLYLFLTCQWNRMLEYDFKSILVVIDDQEIIVTHDQLSYFQKMTDRLDIDPRIIAAHEEELLLHDIVEPQNWLADHTESLSFFQRRARSKSVKATSFDRFEISKETANKILNQINFASEKIKNLVTSQVLYLPTYRRIEQDLQSIFPDINHPRWRKLLAQKTRRSSKSGYVELVEFGMADVERAIRRKMEEIKDRQRNGLSNLTGRYLRDVIQGVYQDIDLSKLTSLETSEIDAIFSRIDDKLLPDQEQQRLRDIVTQIHLNNSLKNEDKVVGHFFIRLLELHKAQQEHEKDVREFVKLCNLYLKNKKMVYNDLNFELLIKLAHTSLDSNREKMINIPMSMLSSGEKQIVSLFSHFYLSGKEDYFIIIDEPELSISVPWQKRFLPDMLGSERCIGLIAVTHSPFIFDNNLINYAHALSEFMEPVDGFS